jgi:hypothetical protein
MAVLGITLRTVQMSWARRNDLGRRTQGGSTGLWGSTPARRPSLCRQVPCHSAASASLQSARTDRLGRLRRPARKRNACSALWLMAKTPAERTRSSGASGCRHVPQNCRSVPQARQKQRPPTHSEVERYLLVTWNPLHPLPVFHVRRRHVAARIAEIATDHGARAASAWFA